MIRSRTRRPFDVRPPFARDESSLTPLRRSCISVVLALAVDSAGAGRLHAQVTPDRVFAALRSDSTVWERVLVHVVSSLSTELVREAADTGAQPWELHIAADEPRRHVLEAQLTTILRARPAATGDSVVHSLEIGPLRVQNDTARVEVRFEETRRCRGTTRTTGSGWAETVLVPRHPHQKYWGAAFSRSTIAGDRVLC